MYESNDFLRGSALFHVSHALRKKGLRVDDITRRNHGNLLKSMVPVKMYLYLIITSSGKWFVLG